VTLSLTIIETVLLVCGGAAAASHAWVAIIGFHIERFFKPTQRMFSLTVGLLSYSVLMMTLATSPLGAHFPVLLVGPSVASGFIAASFMVYISGVVRPLQPASRGWLLLGVPGVVYAVAVCSVDGGLEHLLQFVHFGSKLHHPILTPLFVVHSLGLMVSLVLSAWYIISGFKNLKDPRQRTALYWLTFGIIIAVILMVFGNIAPLIGHSYLVRFVPMLTLPVGLLCYRSLQVQAATLNIDRTDGKVEVEKRLESLGRMARGVSHDINNMLTSVMGSAELIRFKMKDNEELIVHLNQIVNTSVRAGQLMEGMLSFSGRGRTLESIRPAAPILEAIQAAQVQCPEKIELAYDLDEDLPWVAVAPQDLVNAVLNLVINGFDAIGDRPGVIQVTARFMETAIIPESAFGAQLDGHPSMLITVRDDGCGMNEETQAYIYEPFFSTKPAGRGLGLMSVFSIIQHCGGAISCESSPGDGALFKLWVPIGAAPPEVGEATCAGLSHCRLVLVEDNRDVRSVLEELLRTMQLKVQSYSSAEEAWKSMQDSERADTDVYLLDIRLPGMSGIELSHQILAEQPQARIVFMSGDEHEQTMEQFSGRTHIGFMRKPINMEILSRALLGVGLKQQE
jgi:signal transduction histidine kinase/ActR/RegA family two-component response regulator